MQSFIFDDAITFKVTTQRDYAMKLRVIMNCGAMIHESI